MMKMQKKYMFGFSLMELSITIVISGLLMAAVTSGLHLLQASTINKTISELTGYVTATNNFRDKYRAWPGDMSNAQSFWGSRVTNGDGNEQVSNQESLYSWQEMALSGLIAGSYTGQYVTTINYQAGVNLPSSVIPGGFYIPVYWSNVFATSGNVIQLGSFYSNTPWGSAMNPSDAHIIDTKIDDGYSDQGNFYALRGNEYAGQAGYCVTNDYGSATASYALTTPTISAVKSCRLAYWVNKN